MGEIQKKAYLSQTHSHEITVSVIRDVETGPCELATSRIKFDQPPDPINNVYSLPGKYISIKYFNHCSIKIFKIMFRGFILKNPTKI